MSKKKNDEQQQEPSYLQDGAEWERRIAERRRKHGGSDGSMSWHAIPKEYAEKLFNRSANKPQFAIQKVSRRTAQRIELNQAKKAFYYVAQQLFPGFVFDEYNTKPITSLLQWAVNDKDGELHAEKGIYLYGAYGRGKTAIMKILQRTAAVLDLDCRFVLHNTRSIVRSIRSQEFEYSTLKKNCCFDDLGREELVAKLYGNEVAPMEEILDECYQHYQTGRAIYFVTSNLSPDQIGPDNYGQRMQGIFKEMFNFVLLPGPQRRG